ncbi:RNA-binding S4 domain-containing protein [Aestuariimicrobium kwangyangense]|uniref:RNA-binding S4 domain-containing protein n=1 Tax=Aestuariimicrobium kwangyangense TaxID=396389 RepID=UPI0003B72DDA|nr:RNA-binding S4 domain-containing protein [Aestuariimicrobium kwangyangense]
MSDEPIRLGQFLKFTGLADTGGEAREWIQAGKVTVDGDVETRRGRQLADGMVVEVTLPQGTTRRAVVGEEYDPFS